MKWGYSLTCKIYIFKIVADVHRKDRRKMLDQAYFSSLLYVLSVNQFVSFFMWSDQNVTTVGYFFLNILGCSLG